MILSLLKVIILSAICGLSPIKAVSSEVQTDLTADIGKTNIKRYLSVEDDYIAFNGTDFSQGYFTDYVFPFDSSDSEIVNFNLTYVDTDDITHNLVVNSFTFDSVNKKVQLGWGTTALFMEFGSNPSMYTYNIVTHNSDNVETAILPYNNNYPNYFTFYKSVYKYFYDTDFSHVEFTTENLNYRFFPNIARWAQSELNEDNYLYVFCYYPIISDEIIYLDSYNTFMFVNEDNLYFLQMYINQSDYYFGAFGYSDGGFESFVFQEGFTIYISNQELYQSFLRAYQLDIEYNRSNYFNSVASFDTHFNYNAPYDTDIKSAYVYDTYFVWESGSNSQNEKAIEWRLPIFLSNGVYYRSIRLYFKSAIDKYFMTNEDTDPLICYQTKYGYYDRMVYVRADNGLEDTVNVRLKDTFNFTQSAQHNVVSYFAQDSMWINDNYRRLTFAVSLHQNDLDFLAKFNYNSSNNLIGTDLPWISQSFNLINVGLVGIMGFFDIQVLPGLSIGAIILVPFAVSMLFLAISFFKR